MKKHAFMLGAMLALALCTAGFSACSTGAGVTGDRHQQIATACEAVASGLDAVTSAYRAGKVSQSVLQTAVDVAQPTVEFCEPEPKVSLSSADYGKLLEAAIDLTVAAKESK